MMTRRKAGSSWVSFLVLIVSLALIAGVSVVVWNVWQAFFPQRQLADGCRFEANDVSVYLDVEQSEMASIITAESVRRDLAPRAASIALATAFQESKIRNIDYGDRDSVGLFQQRPSQGWGSVAEIMDPWYSSGKFYAAMVKVKNWQTGDINDVAQKVQISGFPEAYRKHVPNARAIASVLRGHSHPAMTCRDNDPQPGDPSGLNAFLAKTMGDQVVMQVVEGTLLIEVKADATKWAAASLAMANTHQFGINSVQVGDQMWRVNGEWGKAKEPINPNSVRVAFN